MKKVLLVSHGTMAEGMKRAIQMIIGEGEVTFEALCLDESKDIAVFGNELEALLATYVDQSHILVLADLKGGSPFTKTLEVLQKLAVYEKSTVIAGMNLSLALELAFVSDYSDKELIQSKIEEARMSMGSLLIETDDDDDL